MTWVLFLGDDEGAWDFRIFLALYHGPKLISRKGAIVPRLAHGPKILGISFLCVVKSQLIQYCEATTLKLGCVLMITGAFRGLCTEGDFVLHTVFWVGCGAFFELWMKDRI